MDITWKQQNRKEEGWLSNGLLEIWKCVGRDYKIGSMQPLKGYQ